MKMGWRPGGLGLALALTGLVGCGGNGGGGYGSEVGRRAWPFALEDTTGQRISLAGYRGQRHVVLQFYVGQG
jgi:hypothetical protein